MNLCPAIMPNGSLVQFSNEDDGSFHGPPHDYYVNDVLSWNYPVTSLLSWTRASLT